MSFRACFIVRASVIAAVPYTAYLEKHMKSPTKNNYMLPLYTFHKYTFTVSVEEKACVPFCHFCMLKYPIPPASLGSSCRRKLAGIHGNRILAGTVLWDVESSCLSQRTDQINQLIGSIWLCWEAATPGSGPVAFLDPQEPGDTAFHKLEELSLRRELRVPWFLKWATACALCKGKSPLLMVGSVLSFFE